MYPLRSSGMVVYLLYLPTVKTNRQLSVNMLLELNTQCLHPALQRAIPDAKQITQLTNLKIAPNISEFHNYSNLEKKNNL